MQSHAHPVLMVALIAAVSVACAGPQRPAATAGDEPPRQSRTLRMAVKDEVADLAPKIPGSSSPNTTKRLFNATLALIDGTGVARPYLAETLPQLNTDAWRVFPDGRMETRYQLRAGLTWQDGAPLTAEDFAFAFTVYREPALGFLAQPEELMDAVLTPDPRTLIVQWRAPFAGAGALELDGLVPLPRHLIQATYEEYRQGGARETFFGRPFWTVEYVGAGPYRLTHWEPGAQLQGEAFAGHGLGRPRIDRVVVRVFNDENTVLANVLAGDQLDYTNFQTLKFEHVPTVRREWEAAGKGVVMPIKNSGTSYNPQQRPESVGDPALLDVRVRRAIAHTLDRQAVNEGVFDGIGFPSEASVPDSEPVYQELERARMKFPPDQQRAEQLMAEAGFTRDGAGLFADASGRRFRLDVLHSAGTQNERTLAILSDAWRRAGFDVTPSVLSQADQRNLQTRHNFPGLASRGGTPVPVQFISAEIGSPANRWAGENRGGWSNPEYDRLYAAFASSLDPDERTRAWVQMMTTVNDLVLAYLLFFNVQTRTWVTGLHGPDIGVQGFGLLATPTTVHWNIHEWEFR
jgi:peptide/nickel transport system substrate-binding protein